MSELPEQRSKRQFCGYLKKYEWVYQVTFFYQSKEASDKAIEDAKRLKNLLSRRFPETAMLWRMQLKRFSNIHLDDKNDDGYTNMPYHVFYFSRELIDFDFDEWCRLRFEEKLYAKNRRLSREKISQAIHSIQNGNPHRLKDHFGKAKVNRFSLLNKEGLVVIDGIAQ